MAEIITPAAVGNILTVGPGKQYSTIAAAIAASKDGDTIQVQAGYYVNDFAHIKTDITLQGVGGMVNMICTQQIPNGKAIFITDGDITINNFAFAGARVKDLNGAGIRYQSGDLVLNKTYFWANENGLLAAPNTTGSITINDSEFTFNGRGDGYTHNLYVGKIANLTINNSDFLIAKVGHQIKSRALNTTIENSRIYDGTTGTASYSVDLPNGDNAVIRNNEIQQGIKSENAIVIAYGAEGNINAGSKLVVSDNTIRNDLSSPSSVALRNWTTVTAQITNNEFFGLASGKIASGPNVQTGNQFLASAPPLVPKHPWKATESDEAISASVVSQVTDVADDQSSNPASGIVIPEADATAGTAATVTGQAAAVTPFDWDTLVTTAYDDSAPVADDATLFEFGDIAMPSVQSGIAAASSGDAATVQSPESGVGTLATLVSGGNLLNPGT